MAEKTELNPEISNITLLNDQILALNNRGNITEINPLVVGLTRFQNGVLLNDKYKIISRLETESGEADLYLCEYDSNNYIAKVYKRDHSNKSKVSETLQRIDSPYVASIVDMFEIDNMQIEILPYYVRGSLQGVKLSEVVLKEKIIPDLIEGLKVLHDNDIVHKDIKPSNIMWADNGEDVVIIDFGISSLLEGNSVRKTYTGITLMYAPPESLTNLVTPLSDYYSLGITIYEFLLGKTPYENLTKEELQQMYAIQKIPIPDSVSEDFRDLIKGLTYKGIENANDPNSTDCRWGYEKVKNWCEGIKQVVPGTGVGGLGDMRQYRFRGITYSTRESLAQALAENWDEGKGELFRGNLSKTFQTFDKKTADILEGYEKEYSAAPNREDIIFWKSLYSINDGTLVFYWKNVVFDNLQKVGEYIIDTYKGNSFEGKRIIESIIDNKLFSRYIDIVAPNNVELKESLDAIEKRYSTSEGVREKTLNCFVLGYLLSSDKTLTVDKQVFTSIPDLINYILQLKSQSLDKFELFCKKLINIDNELTPQFEGWLIANGKQDIIHEWKHTIMQ